MSGAAASEFEQLIRDLQEGSDAAAMQLLELYGPHVQRVVRRRLAAEIRARYDSADFVQAVWASFFANVDRLTHFESAEQLIAYLARMATNKVIDEVRRGLIYKRRNVKLETRIDVEQDSTGPFLKSNEPTPSEKAVAAEAHERLVRDQPSRYRRIVELRTHGCTFVEIAERLDIHERTARRVIQQLTERMAQ